MTQTPPRIPKARKGRDEVEGNESMPREREREKQDAQRILRRGLTYTRTRRYQEDARTARNRDNSAQRMGGRNLLAGEAHRRGGLRLTQVPNNGHTRVRERSGGGNRIIVRREDDMRRLSCSATCLVGRICWGERRPMPRSCQWHF